MSPQVHRLSGESHIPQENHPFHTAARGCWSDRTRQDAISRLPRYPTANDLDSQKHSGRRLHPNHHGRPRLLHCKLPRPSPTHNPVLAPHTRRVGSQLANEAGFVQVLPSTSSPRCAGTKDHVEFGIHRPKVLRGQRRFETSTSAWCF